jgi:hypothetical protein
MKQMDLMLMLFKTKSQYIRNFKAIDIDKFCFVSFEFQEITLF